MTSPEQALFVGQTISIPAGTELNFGKHEDGDFVTFSVPVVARVTGELFEGAVTVSIDGFDHSPLYYHQHVLVIPK